ncbi:hypothetical protein WJX73_009722 [Symbiochloris irregularis]|uniref:Uncharacterized protein n=1 Tax=Symbiochloris irregularis TaxID=706552 RepID=A0AAW1P5T2_9CHLO
MHFPILGRLLLPKRKTSKSTGLGSLSETAPARKTVPELCLVPLPDQDIFKLCPIATSAPSGTVVWSLLMQADVHMLEAWTILSFCQQSGQAG